MKGTVLLITIAFTSALSVRAQIPVPPDPVCAFCGVDLKSQQPHKPGCRYYSEPASEESSSSPNSSSSSTSSPKSSGPSPTMPFENGRCPECGRPCKPLAYLAADNIHSGCRLGEAIKDYHHYMHVWGTAKKRKAIDEAWNKMKDSESRIMKVAEEALRRGYPITQTSTYSVSSSSSSASSQSSTKLKDYTPASERPMVSEPLMEMPLRQPAPQFSSINETNIRHEKPVSIIGKHEWGEISEESLSAFESLMGEEIPREYDIERYNHDRGTAILGTHKDNGRYHWTILCPRPDGSCMLISQEELKGGFFYGSQNVGELRDVHFEGQGAYIIAEYTSGYRQVYLNNGELARSGYNIKVLGSMVEGKHVLYVGKDEDTIRNMIFNEDGEFIVDGDDIEQYDDAIIVKNNNNCYLSNWKGDLLEIGDINSFEDIRAYNNQGSYYILKDRDKGYAVIGRGFMRVGDWYDSEEEAHQAWRQSR